MRFGADIYALRIANVIEPHEYETLFPTYLEKPEMRVRNAWCYIDARDLGQIVDLAIRKDGLGYQAFNAVNDTVVSRIPTADLLARYLPDVPVTRDMGEFEGVISSRKIHDMLGFREEHDWRKYV
ncbi:hypothetical protein COL154_014336 [Colletotrichum chrysophilum]|nr:hypothetical protein COL154_014336 [Colletotrichum chrysophilum]